VHRRPGDGAILSIPGSGDRFVGGIVAYAPEVKFDKLGVPPGPVITAAAALDMARGACALFGTDAAVATTGVAGPETEEGQPVGTVFIGLVVEGEPTVVEHHLDGGPDAVRCAAADRAVELLRRHARL
jgi:PncC family amidohydrolase